MSPRDRAETVICAFAAIVRRGDLQAEDRQAFLQSAIERQIREAQEDTAAAVMVRAAQLTKKHKEERKLLAWLSDPVTGPSRLRSTARCFELAPAAGLQVAIEKAKKPNGRRRVEAA